MNLSRELKIAAQEIRGAEAALVTAVAALEESGVWSGSDAQQFQRDWNDQVSAPLRSAARTIDVIDMIAL